MNKADVREAKAAILRCLTEDFEYGKTKAGKPLKRPKKNQHYWDAKGGHSVYCEPTLPMVMDKVVLGLYFAMDEEVAP